MMFLVLRSRMYAIFFLLFMGVCSASEFELQEYVLDQLADAKPAPKKSKKGKKKKKAPKAEATEQEPEQATKEAPVQEAQTEPAEQEQAAPEAEATAETKKESQDKEKKDKAPRKKEKNKGKTKSADASAATPKAEVPTVEDEKLVGIDTVDLEAPQGNWLFKRLWWERAEEKYEEIRSLQAHILELRMPFFMKRTDVNRMVLDPFYLQVAKNRGALEFLMGDIAEFLAQEMQEGMLGESQRNIRDQLLAERETLEQLQKNIQAVLSFDHELDAAIGTLMEQLSRVNDYEQEAWAYFKEIGRVLDDKKAREYVLKMKHIYRNIKEIEEYIAERFTVYFDQLIALIADHAQKVTATMDQLKEKGIDLKEQLAQVKEESQQNKQEAREEIRKPILDERGFIDRWFISPIGSFISTLWSGAVTVFSWPYEMIFGSKKPAKTSSNHLEEQVIEVIQE